MDDLPCPLRLRPGRPRSEAARRAILRAAHDLLALDEAGVTMSAIAERAGVSKATLYRWWPNKAAVLMDAWLEATARGCAAPDTGCVREDLRRLMRAAVGAFAGLDGRAMAQALAEAQADPEAASSFRARCLAPRRAEARAVLARAQARGEICPDADLDTATDALYGPLYLRLLAGHAPLTPCFADALVRIVMDGLAKE